MTETRTDDCELMTPQELRLPPDLAERIIRVIRLAGLPLALENHGVGVYLQAEHARVPREGHGRLVEVTWLVPDELLEASDAVVNRDRRLSTAAEQLVGATVEPMEAAIDAILTAAGLIVAPHPQTRALSVWAATSGPAEDLLDHCGV